VARGGKRDGAGRPKGSPNKATVDVKEAAQSFTEDALKILAEIMKGEAHPAAARVSAANALLDRAHGKPKQSTEISGAEGGAIVTAVEWRIVDPSPGDA
jgi:hypothetical protein